MSGNRPLWPLFAVAAALRMVRLNGPMVGVHSWRQADTAAIARHFAQGQMLWWLPQIDWAGAGQGYVEAEFPLYPYLVAWLYRLAGVQEWLGRALSVVFSLLTLWLILRIGRRLLGAEAAWWGGLIWAMVPLSVYYGRTFQAESLMVLMAAFCLDRFLAWQDNARAIDLGLCWLAFTICGLLKVLPLLWLGLPLGWLLVRRHGWRGLARPGVLLFALSSLACTASWYVHAHLLGQGSGQSFGFWMGDTNRYSWSQLIGPQYWLSIVLRFSLRGLAVVGLPLLVAGVVLCLRHGIRQDRPGGREPGGGKRLPVDAAVLVVGLGSVLLAGALAPESSAVHEYYQLPLVLFAAPLMGLALARLEGRLRLRRVLIGLLIATSLTILSLDYWLVEQRQQTLLLPLAEAIQRQTSPEDRIISVTGSDPTLLNLARRRGWLIKPDRLTSERIASLRAEGADAIAASFQVVESYSPYADDASRQRLRALLCGSMPPAGRWSTDGERTDQGGSRCPDHGHFAVVTIDGSTQALP